MSILVLILLCVYFRVKAHMFYRTEVRVIVRSIILFALAGLAEIGSGYLMWLWLREGRPL